MLHGLDPVPDGSTSLVPAALICLSFAVIVRQGKKGKEKKRKEKKRKEKKRKEKKRSNTTANKEGQSRHAAVVEKLTWPCSCWL